MYPSTAQILKETGAGFVGGLIIGAVIKKIGKLAFSTVGGGITCISGNYDSIKILEINSSSYATWIYQS